MSAKFSGLTRIALASAQIDPEYVKNITVYHLNPKSAGEIPIDMDTGDVRGDLYFYLDEFLLPLECSDPDASRSADFDCNNPERSGDLVVTQVEMEVDSRMSAYQPCNYCDSGVDPITHKPCEIGKYVCDCSFGHCDNTKVGVENISIFVHDMDPRCSAALESFCGNFKGDGDACNSCIKKYNFQLSLLSHCSPQDIIPYCPAPSKCATALEDSCTDVKANSTACSACAKKHSDVCGQSGEYQWCPEAKKCGMPGKEWDCWRSNIPRKTYSGQWFSHRAEGLCNESSPVGSCGWRVLSSYTVEEECLRGNLMDAVEGAGNAACFDKCGSGRNQTDPCWIGCFFDTLLGPEARSKNSWDAVAGMDIKTVEAAWTHSFKTDGGCPKVTNTRMMIV